MDESRQRAEIFNQGVGARKNVSKLERLLRERPSTSRPVSILVAERRSWIPILKRRAHGVLFEDEAEPEPAPEPHSR